MADPLSLAASVAGLVSLGIQVTSGIQQYLDAIDCRDEELSFARRQNDVLASAIDIIEGSTAKLEHVSPGAAAVAIQNLALCRDSLDSLEIFVAKLAGSNVSTWRSRLKTKAARMHYVFDRPKVQQLSTRVSQTGSLLQLAVDGLKLSTVAIIHESVANIEARVPGLGSGIKQVQEQINEHHRVSTQQMTDNTNGLSDQIASGRDMSQLLFHIQHGYLERIQDRVTSMEDSLHKFILENHADNGLPDNKVSCTTIANQLVSNDQGLQVPLSRTIACLAAKPAAFRELCEILLSHDSFEATDNDLNAAQSMRDVSGQTSSHPRRKTAFTSKNTIPCICGRRLQTSMSRQHSRLGSFYLYKELTSQGHSPYCPMSKRVPSNYKWRYGLRYTGLVRTIKAVIETTFDITSGAGGWSINPGFRYYPTVNAREDPAFRVLNTLSSLHAKLFWSSDFTEEAEFITVIHQAAIRKIRHLFTSRRTSPFVVDSENQSLMHAAFNAYM